METIFVKPRAGMLVRLEDATRHVSADGEEVAHTAYTRCRLRDGDLVKANAAKAAEGVLTWKVLAFEPMTTGE